MAEKPPIDRELPERPPTACKYLYKDQAQYRTARDIWLCTKDDRLSEISRKKGEKCLLGKWCDR
ncbi:MAG: hypothetical protein ACYCXF_04600 [Thermoleophilia bacterium]